ncbi:MAG: TolC family protein [Sedimentisphaerales bacterium]|nr:TolC family protein [Sedimentisphaerales bacterium]
MQKITWIVWQCSLAGILLGLAGGCSRRVREPQVVVEMPDSFSSTGSAPLPEQWWRAFADEDLHALIEQALTNSFTLQTAWDRLAQVHAVARQTDATLWPQADLQAGARRTRREDDRGTSYSSLYSVGVAAGYEVDLWSRLGSAQKAAWLDVQAGRDALDAAAITLSASIANTWYQLAAAKAVLRISRKQIEANEKVLGIVTVQFRKGLASAADVLRQRQLVTSTEATLISAQETVSVLQYALSVLIGETPESQWEESVIEFPELPALPDLGIPSELLQRRPDIRQAHRRVQAADQRLAVAIADQYPRLSISASAEMSSVSMRDLLDDWLANLAANAVQPLFDADRRKAEVQRQEAVVRESIHTWSQAILEALQEVETALTQERQQKQLLENLGAQLRLARQTYERNGESFLKGQVDYIRVLESLQSLQQLELNVVTAQRTLVARRIDLYRSIAGPCDLPAPALAQIDSLMQTTEHSEDMIQAN